MALASLRAAAAVAGWVVVVLACDEVGAGGGDMEPPIRRVEAQVRGTVGISSEGLLEERFRVPATVRAALEQLEPGAAVAFSQWPVAPGEHRPIRLERRSIYAAGARVFEIGDSGVREVPRSPRIHYLGVIEDEVGSGVLLTLLQGTTFLRTGSDPYSQNSGGSASGAELNEFGSYWKNHYQGVNRALAAMLSGKSPSSSSASGIAWIGGLCSSSYGYSFSKVFKINYLSGDAKVVGHELGHNFGSPHTHCYSPPVDRCWNGEGGRYSGATSCPGGPGTLMSYCHLVGCGSTLQFHPTVVNRILNSYVTPATGLCVFEASQSGDDIFTDGFEGGGIGVWSSSVP
jgi:hypothetical protein